MAGAIDLYSGSKSITGTNLFQVDKDPLNEIFEGIEDVIGREAGAAAGAIQSSIELFAQAIINAITGALTTGLKSVEIDIVDSLKGLTTFFDNLTAFLGDINPLSPDFVLTVAAENFINDVLSLPGILVQLTDGLLDGAWIPPLDASIIATGEFAAAELQALIDPIAAAFGGAAGQGFSALNTALESWSGGVLGQLAQALGSIGNVQQLVYFLQTGLSTVAAGVGDLIDTVVNVFNGTIGLVNFELADLAAAIQSIPAYLIESVLGVGSIADDIQRILNLIPNAFGKNGIVHTIEDNIQLLMNIPPVNIANVLGGDSLGHDVQNLLTNLNLGFGFAVNTLDGLFAHLGGAFGSTFPKSFPYTFGVSTPATLVPLVKFQQLVDGIVNDGNIGHDVSVAVGALQHGLAAARSDVSQAIMDGVNAVNEATGVAIALQNQSPKSIQSIENYVGQTGNHLLGDLNLLLQPVKQVATMNDLGNAIQTGLASVFHLFSGNPLVGSVLQGTYAALGEATVGYVEALNTNIGTTASGAAGLNVTLDFSSYPDQSDLSGIFVPGGSGITAATMASMLDIAVGNAPPNATALEIRGGNVQWNIGAFADAFDFEYYTQSTSGPYQVISATVESWEDLQSVYVHYGYTGLAAGLVLIGRSNTAMNTLVLAYIGLYGNGKGIAMVGCLNSGVWTKLDSKTITLVDGTSYQFECGAPETNNPYEYTIFADGVNVLTYIDPGGANTSGSVGNFIPGVGAITSNGIGGIAPVISSWGAADNAPGPITGSYYRAYCSSTTPVSMTTGPLPTTFYDTIVGTPSVDLTVLDPGLNPATPNPVDNGVQVSVAGIYVVTVTVCVNDMTHGNMVSVYKSGTLIKRGAYQFVSGGTDVPVGFTFLLPCVAGDIIQPGVWSTGTQAYDSAGDDLLCYFEIALANCGTIS